jgi:histidinol-phosphate aminotransferase
MRPPIRPDIEDLEPYVAPQLDAPVRLNTNECPYPLPAAFAEDVREALAGLSLQRYPDREATELRKALAGHAGHTVEGVWVANGSNEVIQHLCLAYGGPERRALVFEPTYALHTLIPRITGMEVVGERLADGFGLPADAEAVVRARRPDVVFVCSPNNPTGNAQPPEAVAALCRVAQGLVVVDEAYVEFGGRPASALLVDHENLAVVRTFSKAFALAGARIGYCLTTPEVCGELRRVRLPYHLSAVAQAVGRVALRYRTEAESVLDRVRAERDRLVRGLEALDGVEVYPSQANFVLFRTLHHAGRLWQMLLERDVLVRDVSTAPRLDRCLRVTAGTPEETDAFLGALAEALGDLA